MVCVCRLGNGRGWCGGGGGVGGWWKLRFNTPSHCRWMVRFIEFLAPRHFGPKCFVSLNSLH